MQHPLHDGFFRGDRERGDHPDGCAAAKSALLDETDAGLDLDALRTVFEGVKARRCPDLGTLVIAHCQRLRESSMPGSVQVMPTGTVVITGGTASAMGLAKRGQEWVEEQFDPSQEATTWL